MYLSSSMKQDCNRWNLMAKMEELLLFTKLEELLFMKLSSCRKHSTPKAWT